MNETNYLPTEIYNTRHQLSENRQGLGELCDTRVPAARPVPIGQPQRVSYVGGQTLKVRLPYLGETGLSESEIEHAINYGISA